MVARVDPRPRTETVNGQVLLHGGRCPACGFSTAADTDWCPLCQTELKAAGFGPGGVVLASTVLHVGVPGHEPPYSVAYVVLDDDGPRVLVHSPVAERIPVGARVELSGLDPNGDLVVAAARTEADR